MEKKTTHTQLLSWFIALETEASWVKLTCLKSLSKMDMEGGFGPRAQSPATTTSQQWVESGTVWLLSSCISYHRSTTSSKDMKNRILTKNLGIWEWRKGVFNPYNNPMKLVPLWSPYSIHCLEMFSNMSKVTQLESSSVRIQTWQTNSKAHTLPSSVLCAFLCK